MIFQSVTLAAGKQKSRKVCLGNLGGGVPPVSLNPDPTSDQKYVMFHTHFQTWGSFLESPGNFTGPKSNIQIKI